MPPEAGELIAGRYRKLGTIGVGGMARVVLAEDERLRRRVAIKALHAEGLEDSAQRFEREARMGASLNHPNLVSIYDVATDRESVLIVMEYVEGKTLKDAIAEGPGRPGLDEETVASVIGDVAAGLDHAHEAGIVHRDVKPANILIREDGVAKLADLGIATAAESTRITRSGMVLGTAVYMAPEQLEGHKPGPAADIYSLAAVAFEALSGRKAREGASPMEIAHKAANGPAPDLLDAWPEAPPAAARALARGMARDPGDRQASAGALAEELERSLADDRPVPSAVLADADRTVPLERRAVAGVPRTPPPRTQLGRRYPRWLPATAAAVLLLAVAAVAFASLGGDDDPPSTADSAADKADKDRQGEEAKEGQGGGAGRRSHAGPRGARELGVGSSGRLGRGGAGVGRPGEPQRPGLHADERGPLRRGDSAAPTGGEHLPGGLERGDLRVCALQPRPFSAPGRSPR